MNAAVATPAAVFEQELDKLACLLALQRQAIVHADADTLPRLAEQVHGRLAVLLQGPLRAATAAQGLRLAELQRIAATNQELLTTRLAAVRRALDAMTPAGSEASRHRGLYQAAGLFASPASRAQAFASA